MPRHPPNALKSLDALIINVHPLIGPQLALSSGVSNLGRLDERTQILRKTYMCSICLPQSGQALRPTYANHASRHGQRKLASKSLHSRCQSARRQLNTERRNWSWRSRRPNAGIQHYRNGGARRDRTDDLKLAKLPLSQLSYGPVSPTSFEAILGTGSNLVGLGRLELPTSRLSSARSNQLSYKPGTQGLNPGTKTIRTVLRPREKEKRRRRCSANEPVTFRL